MDQTRGILNRHVIVEGIVIVLSILLAFGIDAMWAQHQDRLEEQEVLASLESDFAANLVSVDRIIEVYELSAGRIERLISLSPEEIRALSQKEVSEIMLSTANPWTFDPVRGTVDTLVYGGRLAILENPELRKSLVTFLNMVADSHEDMAYLQQGAQDLWLAEIEHGGPWSDPVTEIGHAGDIPVPAFVPKATAEDLLRVRSDPELMGLSKRFHINAAYYIMELQLMRSQIEKILELIAESG